MDLILGIVAIVAILALYAWGLLHGLDFGIRRGWPRWAIAVTAGVICVYTPLWGPVYALGRWMGLWPRRKGPRPVTAADIRRDVVTLAKIKRDVL